MSAQKEAIRVLKVRRASMKTVDLDVKIPYNANLVFGQVLISVLA